MFKDSKKNVQTSSGSQEMNHISVGTKIVGDIITTGNLRLDGELDGNLVSEARVVLGESCLLKGTLKAQNAEISGKINGTAEVSDELVLKKTADINANMTVGKINIESGAKFNGDIKMSNGLKGFGQNASGKESQKGK